MLIEVSPYLRVPRTFNKFAALMSHALTKLKVRGKNSSHTLLQVVKNPVKDHLPLGIRIIGTSSKAELKTMGQCARELSGSDAKPKSIAFVVGAVSVGNPGMENDYVDSCISIASCGLSAACVCTKICVAYEELWGVI